MEYDATPVRIEKPGRFGEISAPGRYLAALPSGTLSVTKSIPFEPILCRKLPVAANVEICGPVVVFECVTDLGAN